MKVFAFLPLLLDKIPVYYSHLTVKKQPNMSTLKSKISDILTDNLVPTKDKTYVPFGFYDRLKKIIGSEIFYPVYIVGLSGNGKTMMVEQVCANLGRECVRVNITKETDETDLIGSYELIDGNTVRREGPVLIAMRKGAILLLDETDYGSERLLCLQPILEGKPYLDKKTGKVISPEKGFNIIATANTKGKGSDTGQFIGANVLNEAFLERFAITVEQEYPGIDVERTILERNFDALKMDKKKHTDFIDNLVNWSENVRKTYFDGGASEIISTRRLVHIVKAFHIFDDRQASIQLCLNRFDDETKASFFDLYQKIDATTDDSVSEPVAPQQSDEIKDVMDDVVPVLQSPFVPLPGTCARHTPSPPVSQPAPYRAVPTPSMKSTANGNVIAPSQLPVWANPKNLFDISTKYNESVRISETTADYIIMSHGQTTEVDKLTLSTQKEKNPGEFLDVLVGANQAKKMGQIPVDYRPIT
jgi:MoxR-like ATPase